MVFGSGQVARALYQAGMPGWKVVLVPHSAVDIRSSESVRSVVEKERCSIIINAAAFTNVENSEISSCRDVHLVEQLSGQNLVLTGQLKQKIPEQ